MYKFKKYATRRGFMNKSADLHHTHIEPKSKWFDINLKEIWKYRDLIWLFTKRNFILIYKQTLLGPAWIILQPLLSTLIYMVVFGGIAGISTDGLPKILFYLSGTALWGYFSACLTKTASTFTANSRVYGKVYFPRLVSPISTVLSAAFNFLIQFALFLLIWVYFILRGTITPSYIAILTLPLILIFVGMLGLGFGIIISSLTTKYRDLSMLVTFGVQLWMYITPVVYPMSTIENELLRTLIMLNPVTCAMEVFRYIFLGVGQVDMFYWCISIAVMLVVSFIGIVIFNRVEKTFMDTI